MPNSIAQRKNYTNILDEVYQQAACSTCLNSGRGMVRAGAHAHEILIPKISVTGLGDYTRNVGYTDGNITFAYESKEFNYDRGTRLLADVMDVDEIGYTPITRTQANRFFSFVSDAYERSSMVFTTNKEITQWEELVGDRTPTTAMLDRKCEASHLRSNAKFHIMRSWADGIAL